jgi:hypothetical protein
MTTRRRPRSLLVLAQGVSLTLLACGPNQAGDHGELGHTGDGDSEASGDGDPEATGDGDGDAEATGDGDAEATGDGDPGDGDPGDGDGDEDPPPDLPGIQYCDQLDLYLEHLFVDALGLEGGPVPVALAQTLTSLVDYAAGVEPGEYPESLVGIDCAANLVSLRLPPGTVDDLSPLVGLESLQSLALARNQVSQLSPLAAQGKISTLILTHNPLGDGGLTDIAELPLEWLSVGYTEITGLDEIIMFDQLRYLDVNGLPIADLSPLVGSKIVGLELSETLVSDLTPLTAWGPDGLACLTLGDSLVTDLSPLLEVEWVVDGNPCGSCPRLFVNTATLDDYSKDVVIPTLCEMGVNANGCLFCPQ